MSRIIKAREFMNGNECDPHPFPRLEDEKALKDISGGGEKNTFRPGCTGEIQGVRDKSFEAFTDWNKPESETPEINENPEEKYASELKEEFARGFVEGEKSGTSSERQRVEPAVKTLQASVMELEKCRDSLKKHFEKASVDLAIAIAGKVVCHEVSVNRQTIIDVLKTAAEETGGSDILEIRVHPSSLPVLEDSGFSLADLNVENASIEGDSGVQVGGCVIKTAFGCIDAMIDHQLEAVAEALREKL